jgi:hypothetical protein
MVKDVTFQLDPDGGAEILQNMMMPVISQAGQAIGARANSMAQSQSNNPPEIKVSTTVGVIKRGQRAIATVRVDADDQHALYVGRMAITKSKDAGRI